MTILWRPMGRRGEIERIKEIYEKTENFVMIGETLAESFWTAEGVTKPNTVHNIYFGDGRGV